jgi:hypothetical protein
MPISTSGNTTMTDMPSSMPLDTTSTDNNEEKITKKSFYSQLFSLELLIEISTFLKV